MTHIQLEPDLCRKLALHGKHTPFCYTHSPKLIVLSLESWWSNLCPLTGTLPLHSIWRAAMLHQGSQGCAPREQGPLLPPLSWASIGLSPQGRTASAATKAPWSSFPSRHILFTNLLMWLGLVMLLWPRSCSCLRTWQGTMLPCCLDYIKSTVKSKTNPWNRWILSGQGS